MLGFLLAVSIVAMIGGLVLAFFSMAMEWDVEIIGLSAAGAGVLLLLGCAVAGGIDERETFMAECLADKRKPYECTAMWRAGSRTVAPAPVFVPIR